MTRIVSIRGDVADYTDVHIVDEGTKKEIDDIRSIRIEITAGMMTRALLEYSNPGIPSEWADVVKVPDMPEMHAIVLRGRHDLHNMNGYPMHRFSSVGEVMRIDEGGRAHMVKGTMMDCKLEVDAHLVASMNGSPTDFLEEQAMYGFLKLAHDLVKKAVKATCNILGSKAATQQQAQVAVMAPYFPQPAPKSVTPLGVFGAKTVSLPTSVPCSAPQPIACDECGGRGYYESPLTGAKSPCSRGHKPTDPIPSPKSGRP